MISISNQSFRALGASPRVVEALAARGMESPFAIQELVIPEAIAGVDVLAKAPTGSGKTIAFAVPLVERTDPKSPTPSALVLVPTRELALSGRRRVRRFGPMGLRVAAVYGGAPLHAQAKRAKGAHILIATPGRLTDLVERRMLTLSSIRTLVLDEADRMLDMGFKPQVERIVRSFRQTAETMLFSATLDGEVRDLARSFTKNPSRFESEGIPDRNEAEVEHRFESVTAEDKVERLIKELEAERGLALVFVRTKRGADRLAKRLARHDVAAIALHGDMTQSARERALERFRSGKVKTLVATDVAARGLDLVDITHVINFDPPEDDKGYVHRVGRTGRAGRTGSGVTFVTPEQQGDVSRVAARLGHREQFENGGMRTAPMKRVYTSRRGRRSKW